MLQLTPEYQAHDLAQAPLGEPSPMRGESAVSMTVSIPDQLSVQLSRTWIAAWVLALGVALASL